MTLSRDEAMNLMTEYGKSAAWTKHCFAVADAAQRVRSVLEAHCAVDLNFL